MRAKIERLAAQVINNIMAGDGLAYTLPRGGGANVKFVEELDRNFLEYNPMKRQFADASQVKYAVKPHASGEPACLLHGIIMSLRLFFSRGLGRNMFFPRVRRLACPPPLPPVNTTTTTTNINTTSSRRKTTMMTRLMQLIHELTKKGIHSTKRDLFYSDVKLFEKQIQSDTVLEELALMFGCTRHSLQVTASEKGLVVGRIQFDDDADFIDCTKMGRSGKNIPSYIDRVSNIKSDYDRPAEFILLVEKDAAFQRLAEDRFYNTYPCIIITVRLSAPRPFYAPFPPQPARNTPLPPSRRLVMHSKCALHNFHDLRRLLIRLLLLTHSFATKPRGPHPDELPTLPTLAGQGRGGLGHANVPEACQGLAQDSSSGPL